MKIDIKTADGDIVGMIDTETGNNELPGDLAIKVHEFEKAGEITVSNGDFKDGKFVTFNTTIKLDEDPVNFYKAIVSDHSVYHPVEIA
jgi:hypothetical protein